MIRQIRSIKIIISFVKIDNILSLEYYFDIKFLSALHKKFKKKKKSFKLKVQIEMQNRLQPAFSVRNAFQNDGIVDATPFLNNKTLVGASGQPFGKSVNPREVVNPDAFGTPTPMDRSYWRSKNRVNAPINPRVPRPEDRAYWRSKRVVNNDEQSPQEQEVPVDEPAPTEPRARAPWGVRKNLVQADGAPFGNRHGNISSDPQARARQLARHKQPAKAAGQPFSDKGPVPKQNVTETTNTPTNEDRNYWKSKNRVAQPPQAERILVNGVMTEVTFVNQLPQERFEAQGTQSIQSAINARNQELAKLNSLREQQVELDDKRTALLNKVNRQGFQAKVKACEGCDTPVKAARSFTPKNK